MKITQVSFYPHNTIQRKFETTIEGEFNFLSQMFNALIKQLDRRKESYFFIIENWDNENTKDFKYALLKDELEFAKMFYPELI